MKFITNLSHLLLALFAQRTLFCFCCCSSSPEQCNSWFWDEIQEYGAVHASKGTRHYMEDFFVMETNGTDLAYYGILDGHGGDFAADFGKEYLMQKLRIKVEEAVNIASGIVPTSGHPDGESSSSNRMARASSLKKKNTLVPAEYEASYYVDEDGKINFGEMLTDLILLTDYELLHQLKKGRKRGGSTLLLAVHHKTELTVANVGDSRGVMCDRNGKVIPISFDHKPNDSKEQKRIKKAGGYISYSGNAWRVAGILATSRALGDYDLKQKKYVIAKPDILTFELKDHNPKFIILASDGLWDVFTSREAVAFIASRLHEAHFGAKSIAIEAHRRGSGDNVTVMVIVFKDGRRRRVL